MLKPFQQEEKSRMRMFETADLDDMTFQTTFGWLGSCRGMGGKMVTMASYLNERVQPVRVRDRAWTRFMSAIPDGGGPSAVMQTNRVVYFNPHDLPDVSFDADGNERQTTLIVVSSETTFEMDRWRTAMDQWTTCRTVCVRSLTDVKRIFPSSRRVGLNADTLTSELLATELVRANIEVVVINTSTLERYRKLFGEIAWTRIVLNDGLSDHLIWRIFQTMSHDTFPARFVWLIEALSDSVYEDRLHDPMRLAGLTHAHRFSRRNWLESMCSAGVLRSLVIRTNDLTVQSSSQIVKHLDMRVFEDSGENPDMQTKEYRELLLEERCMNASFWVNLSEQTVRMLEGSGRNLEIIRKASSDAFVRTEASLEEAECPVCLGSDRCRLEPCGHGMCRGCCAGLLMRNLTTPNRCPLCRSDMTGIRVDEKFDEEERVHKQEREGRIRAAQQAHLTQLASHHDSLVSNIRTCIGEILASNEAHRVLLVCVPMQYHQLIETGVPHTPLHLTMYEPPSRDERVFYANQRLFAWTMFRRVPFELSEVTHILVVRDSYSVRHKSDDEMNFDIIDMLRVWSLARTTHSLHYIFFDGMASSST